MKSRAIYLGLTVFIALFLIPYPSLSAPQQRVHVVQKGDTLWALCNTYYHDPWIWPELWEMNKFITNPHWIKPGEVVMILDYEELKAKSPKKSSPVVKKIPSKKPMGVDVSIFVNTKALGFLSKEPVEPSGRIFDFEAEKILLRENDTAYVKMQRHGIKPGDKFTIYNTSEPLNHPLTKEIFGYVNFFKGILEIQKVEKGYHIARISESFRSIQKNDLLIPYYPVSSCILPIPCNSALSPHIVAAKENLTLHGQYSVIYIDAGHENGVMTGHLFEAIRERTSISNEEKKEEVTLPPTVLGKILILETKKHTATGVVFCASKDFGNGVKLRPLTWEGQAKESAQLPACPIQ